MKPLALIGGLVVLAAVPLWVGSTYYVNVAAQILFYAIFALAVNVLAGYAGLVSLGHAGLFGIAAYAGAKLMTAGLGHAGTVVGELPASEQRAEEATAAERGGAAIGVKRHACHAPRRRSRSRKKNLTSAEKPIICDGLPHIWRDAWTCPDLLRRPPPTLDGMGCRKPPALSSLTLKRMASWP